MNKKLIRSIHAILIPLWKSYTVDDILKEVHDWKIDDTEARQRLKVIQDDFEGEAEQELTEKLKEIADWNNEHEEEYPDAPAINKIIKQYSDSFADCIWDKEYRDDHIFYIPRSESADELPPEYIADIMISQSAATLGRKGGRAGKGIKKNITRPAGYYSRIASLPRKRKSAKL